MKISLLIRSYSHIVAETKSGALRETTCKCIAPACDLVHPQRPYNKQYVSIEIKKQSYSFCAFKSFSIPWQYVHLQLFIFRKGTRPWLYFPPCNIRCICIWNLKRFCFMVHANRVSIMWIKWSLFSHRNAEQDHWHCLP